MRREDIDAELKNLSFEYFYWFSRYEFALKENGYLKNETENSKAEPGWETYLTDFCDRYSLTDNAKRLIKLHPKRQIVVANKNLDWRKVGIDDCKQNLVLWCVC